jgi:protein phosphatase
VGHVGDSRIYLLRDKKLQQLTEDHSPIYRLYKEGSLNKEELRHHPQKNLIERSLGLSSTVDSDLFSIELKKGDIFLLCTDGLSDHISDRDIETALQQVSWDDLASHLVQKALAAGGFDNITLVIVEVL